MCAGFFWLVLPRRLCFFLTLWSFSDSRYCSPGRGLICMWLVVALRPDVNLSRLVVAVVRARLIRTPVARAR